MKTKIYLITAILSVLVVLIMPFGMTYAVFSDTEQSTGNVMTVSTRYFVPPPGHITEPNTFIGMGKCGTGNGNKGTFGYNDSNYMFFYNFTGDVPYADSQNDTNKLWALIVYQSPDTYTLIDEDYSDSANPPYKHLVFEGSYEFNGDVLNATIFIIEKNKFNGTETDITGHCMSTVDLVQYHDTHPW